MSDRMEKTRETLEGLNTEMGFALGEKNQLSGIQMRMFQPRIIAALAEVEEWETRLTELDGAFVAWRINSYAKADALGERLAAAEAERDAAYNMCGTCRAYSGTTSGCEECSEFMEESGHNARAALGEQT